MTQSTDGSVEPTQPTQAPGRGSAGGVLLAAACGSAVAVAMGAYARLHDPAGQGLDVSFFSSPLSAKAWLTTAALVLAVVQVTTAAGMWGRLGPASAPWSAPVHRWSGRLAVLATLPVVVHCVYALGYQSYSTRVLAHSLLGCFFFGAFVTKMLVLPRRDVPGWVVPVLGGLVTAGLVGIWLTSSLWFFTTFGLIT